MAAESTTHGISSSRPTGPTGRNDASLSLRGVEGRSVELMAEMWKVMEGHTAPIAGPSLVHQKPQEHRGNTSSALLGTGLLTTSL